MNIDESISNELLEYSEDYVYLNLEEPVACLGYVYNITFCYLKTALSNKLNSGNFSIWEPSANTANSYRKVSGQDVLYSNVQCLFRFRIQAVHLKGEIVRIKHINV